jgi:WD40 repeat protein
MFSGSTHKPLSGRNCLLGDLQDATFTSVCQVAPNKAIVSSERGDLCLIDETDREQNFTRVAHAGFSVSSMAADDKGRLHLAGSHGGLKTLTIASFISKLTPPPSPTSRGESPTISITDCSNQISAIACLAEHIVTVDSQRAIRLSHLCATAAVSEVSALAPSSANDETSIGDVIHTLPAHGDSVLGVRVLSRPNNLNASYYTWAAGGSVIFWSQTGSTQRSLQVALEQPVSSESGPNELRTVRASSDASFLVTGDKLGVLKIIDCRTEAPVYESRAHSAEITSIAIHEDESTTLIASASRDRTVQIFSRESGTWTLLQTSDEHAGAVLGLQFSQNGSRLISSSSDRSIVVREMLSREEDGNTIRVFVFLRCIAFKSTPVSMTWDVDQEDVLLLSTIDRQVHKYDLQSGQCLSNFKASDTDGGDAVVLHSLAHIPREWGSPLIAGVSSTDKSIRIYDESGTLLARDWGHTEGVTDIAFVQPSDAQEEDSCERSLVTVAVDGTVFVWGLALQSPYRQETSKSMDVQSTPAQPTPSLLASKPPLRRVLSQSELAKFQRSPDESGSATPTGNRSPTLKKKFSKFSLDKTPKLDPSPIPGSVRERKNAGPTNHTFLRRKNNTSPSPPASPRARVTQRRASLDVRSRSNLKAPAGEVGSLRGASDNLCKSLKVYRKRLASSTETLDIETVKELQRELAATARAIGERAKTKEFDETVIAKILDQYSEKLLNMFDERIAASTALRARQDNEQMGLSTPLRSHVDYRRSSSPLSAEGETTGGDEDTKNLLTPTTTSTYTTE